MKKTLVFLSLIAAFAIAPSAYACSPALNWPPTPEENLAQKDIGFIGTVTSIAQDKSVNGEYRVTFAVETAYKGDLEDSVTLMIRSSSAACGYDNGYDTFKKGSVWAIYGNGNETDGYSTDSLSLNTSYKTVAAAEEALEAFGFEEIESEEPRACTMQYAPVCGKAKDGTVKTYGNSCVLGAEKAEYLYEGECKAEGTAPTKDLYFGMRGMDVTWLQNFLIAKVAGTPGSLLKAVGATGYFGSLTRNALAQYQQEHGIAPAAGYFGAITRAQIMKDSAPSATATFSGKISAVDVGCFADGICSVTVDGKEVVLLAGLRADAPPVGTLQGVDSIGDLENEIGSTAEVYAAKNPEGSAEYTLYGSASYYVKVLK